jgi:hypothetical protein
MTERLIPLEEAAKLLDMSTEALTELRSQNEIFGYRDGSGWKFKRAEIERFADDRGIELNPGAHDDDLSSDSDLIALDEAEAKLAAHGSDIMLGDDEIDLKQGSSSSNVLSDEPGVGVESPSDTGKMVGGEELLLAEDDLFIEDELRLEEDSDEISLGPDSEISSDFEESDLVIDADSESDIMLDASDSGLNLSPTDSGISLEEEPLEMGGSDIDSLELPEDDEVISLEDSEFEDSAGADDDFMLTPVESLGEDDDSSGSQVIALEDSEIYADSGSEGSDILSGADSGIEEAGFAAPMVPEESFAEPAFEQPAPTQVVYAPAPVDAPYSIWNILGLMCVAGCLAFAGILVFDVLQHINNFEEQGSISATVMDFVLSWVNPG